MNTTPAKTAAPKLSARDQVRLLQRRLDKVSYRQPKLLPTPKAVVEAKARVEQFNARNSAHCEKQRSAHNARVREVTDNLVLGNVEKALKLLQAIETEML